eukprot:2451317-Pyramimonas_sp.AAC.1
MRRCRCWNEPGILVLLLSLLLALTRSSLIGDVRDARDAWDGCTRGGRKTITRHRGPCSTALATPKITGLRSPSQQ